MKSISRLLSATAIASVLMASAAMADGVLSIARLEDSTTFDPIKSAQNVDNWVFSNIFDPLVRVDRSGTNLEPGLAETWELSDDKLTYTFHIRDAKFSNGMAVTAEDAAFSLLRIVENEGSLWSDTYSVIETATATDAKTLVVKLKNASAPFLSTLALPNISILPKAVLEDIGEEAFAEAPIGSGAFRLVEWRRGEKVVLEKNPEYWEPTRVSLDGVEWLTIPDDNTRMLKLQAGEIDAVIGAPFNRVEEAANNADLRVMKDASTREDHLLLNHESGALAKLPVREAIDMAIDKQAIVDVATFGIGEVANSYIPKGALYHYADNLARPYDPAKAKEMIEAAGETGLTLEYVVNAGNATDEAIAVLLQQQLAQAGVTVNLQKVDPSQSWDMLVNGDYDISVMYWTNDVLDPDQKTTFVLGHDANMNYMTRYNNPVVEKLVADARLELDPIKREAMYVELQKTAKADVNWVDLYYSPYVNVTRANVDNFFQNPLGRFFLEDTVKN